MAVRPKREKRKQRWVRRRMPSGRSSIGPRRQPGCPVPSWSCAAALPDWSRPARRKSACLRRCCAGRCGQCWFSKSWKGGAWRTGARAARRCGGRWLPRRRPGSTARSISDETEHAVILAKQRGVYCSPEKWERIRRRAKRTRMKISRFVVLCCSRAASESVPPEPPGHPLALPEDAQRRLHEDSRVLARSASIAVRAPGRRGGRAASHGVRRRASGNDASRVTAAASSSISCAPSKPGSPTTSTSIW